VIRQHCYAEQTMPQGTSPLRDFLRTEAAGGICLLAGAAVALLWANSPWSSSYESLWNTTVSITVRDHTLMLALREWVNQGLITIFFFVVGLEIKRELVSGTLARKRAAFLPVLAAIGGMAAPAVIYLAIADGSTARGWAIVVATDIPLALGVLAIAGGRVSPALRVYLLAIAIVDDIASLLIIAAVYSTGVGWLWLAAALAVFVLAAFAKRSGVNQIWVYVGLGCLLWLMLHVAGVSPTLAGVAMGVLAPTTPRTDEPGAVSVVEWLERLLHPWTSFAIVPLFALANTGVTLSMGLLHSAVHSRLPWAIIAARVIGKPLGILVATKLAVRARLADQPGGASTRLLGVAASAGMGFTVALFVTELALPNHAQRANATLAIVVSAVLAGGVSLAILGLRRGEAA
jgi:NhaA family Na+:H+ antiporter